MNTLASTIELRNFSIFNVAINNVTMNEGIDNIFSLQAKGRTGIAYFVNANSLNQAYESPVLTHTLNRADLVFADGSGVRRRAER